jgi:hypothetical protein
MAAEIAEAAAVATVVAAEAAVAATGVVDTRLSTITLSKTALAV